MNEVAMVQRDATSGAAPPLIKVATQPDVISRRLLLTLWPFIAITIVLVAFGALDRDILSSIRAYVSGESLWSKAQKRAVIHLNAFADSGKASDFQQYRDAIGILLGDRQARLELDRPEPDLLRAREGFLAGQNAPADIPGMIRLYRNFHGRLDYLDRAIAIWAEADGQIEKLDEAARQLRQLHLQPSVDPAALSALKSRILEIDRRLSPMEEAFSNTLGDASRWIEHVLGWAMLLVAIGLMLPGIWLTRRLVRTAARAEADLRYSEQRYELALIGSQDGLWDWNLKSTELYCSPHMLELLGLADDAELIAVDALLRRCHPDDQRRVLDMLRDRVQDRMPLDAEFRVLRGDDVRWLRLRGQVVNDADGEVERMVGSVSDITDREHARSELLVERERSHVTLQSIVEAVITTDRAGRINYLNPVALRLLNIKEADARGRLVGRLAGFHDERSDAKLPDVVAAVLQDGNALKLDCAVMLVRHDRERFPVHLSAAPIRWQAGQAPSGVVMVLRDARQERDYQRQLTWQASHDALTGLCNRHEFERRLGELIARCREQNAVAIAMYIDLDHFKVVNDTGGHPAGDELLRQLSDLLQQQLRKSDLVARLGGDEFGVLLEDCAQDSGLQIADKLCSAVASHRFAWRGRVYSVGASIGVVCVNSATETIEDVLSASDSACYLAKEKGRGRAQSYLAADQDVCVRNGELNWVNRLRTALEKGQLHLHAQEIVTLNPLASHKVKVELLLRLIDDDGELTLPMAFIPAAERYNLMPTLDRWVLQTAARMLSADPRTADGRRIDTLFVNISGLSFGDDHFLADSRALFEANPRLEHRICLEVTETVAIANISKAAHFMAELQAVGARFALDDFGAGMSSFGYLRYLPADFVKIDGSFVRDMLTDPVSLAMVESINAIAHVMGKQTIAEFVESPEILAKLRELGVDYAQGYAVGLPRALAGGVVEAGANAGVALPG